LVDKHVTVSEVKTWTLETRFSVTPAEPFVSTAGHQLQGFMTVITVDRGRLENKQASIHISGAGFKPPSDVPSLQLRITAIHCNPVNGLDTHSVDILAVAVIDWPLINNNLLVKEIGL
jgi:hypothetical protein